MLITILFILLNIPTIYFHLKAKKIYNGIEKPFKDEKENIIFAKKNFYRSVMSIILSLIIIVLIMILFQ